MTEKDRFQIFLDEASPLVRELISLFDDVRDYIAVHEPMFDDNENVVDGRLLAWNRGYETVRVKQVFRHQTVLQTYYEPSSAVDAMHQAWIGGRFEQKFELTPASRDRYRPEGAVVLLNVLWRRMGNFIVEVGHDASENLKLQLQLLEEQSAAAESRREKMLAQQRDRIARHLHDSVIQQLYATNLGLRAVSESANLENEREHLQFIAGSISGIIDEIRNEIFNVSESAALPLEDDLSNVIRPFALAVGARIDLVLNGIEVDDPDLRSHLRAVIRETVSNSVRHGAASRIGVTLTREADDLVLTIEDNGVGLPRQLERRSGLANLSRRASDLGGSFTTNAIGALGTRSVWRVPSGT